MEYFVGLDVGGTNIRIGLVDENLNIIDEAHFISKAYADQMNEVITTFVGKHQDKSIRAISLGYPGLVDQNTLTILHTPNEKRFEGQYLNELKKILKVPIFIGNDVNFLLLYDAKHFKLENESVLGFYLGTGFGNAIKIKNRIYTGEYGAAGEIGHVPVYLEGINRDGQQPDLESIVSGLNLLKIHQKYFKSTPFDALFEVHFNEEPLQHFLHLLAFYIATEITILDIPTIILGGGVMMSEQFPKRYLEKLIQQNLFSQKAKENFKVYYAKPHTKSGILGAIIHATSLLDYK